jgi:7-cyano-7-deazaguanine synthase in queuosine biosynthesis
MAANPACVLYSGGADSTMAAVVMLKNHCPVHLLSFKHCRMSQLDKTTLSAENLAGHFGKSSVIHLWQDITLSWCTIKKNPPSTTMNLKGSFALLLKPCLACKVAMHIAALAYCLEKGISRVADGAHPKGAPLFPEQLNEGIEVIRSFYNRCGIAYETPVYGIERPDFDLYNMGITGKKNTGDEHIYYSNQFACHVGLLAYVYHFLTRPFDKDKKITFRMSIDFLEECLSEESIAKMLSQEKTNVEKKAEIGRAHV